ncbi:MAG: MBL fold metallo-hydrolase [Deltaproteobacteria bacterium]|nr:MBL fold metallo-hydrolase [Deltaproteobacteria bacterium]
MKVLCLGTGTCFPPRPEHPWRMPPLFLVELPGLRVLFDCSEGARWRLAQAGVDPASIAHVAVSHPHPDHAALPQFVQARACATRVAEGDVGLAIHLPARSHGAIKDLWRWHHPEDDGRLTSRLPIITHGAYDGYCAVLAPGVLLKAFSVHHGHGHSPSLAWRLEHPGGVFAYSGDTGLCEGVLLAATGADLFVCEASAAIGTDMSRGYGHLNPHQAGSLASLAGVRGLHLTHYTGEDSAEAMVSEARQGGYEGPCTVLTDGDVLEG